MTEQPNDADRVSKTRKFLVIVDDSAEVESALYFAAHRCHRTYGIVQLLYVIEPQEFQHWIGVKEVQIEEETARAKALFRLFRRKLAQNGFDHVQVEDVVREGSLVEQIRAQIAEDRDVAILVLGAAASGNKGPGPLVASLGAGANAGTFPIPITIVPGNLTLEQLRAMA